MGLLDSVIEAAKQQYQTTKRGFGLLASNPQQFAQEATTRYFPTKEEEAQFAQAQAASGDYTQTPYYQKVMDLSQVPSTFIGKGSKIWDKLAEQRFLQLEKQGIPVNEIWKQTGTLRGFDNKLRQEISDKNSFLMGSGSYGDTVMNRLTALESAGLKKSGDPMFVEDIYYHPELLKAYPNVAKIESEFTPKGVTSKGRLGDNNLQMQYNLPSNDAKSVMIHELQHSIQGVEGFAPGANFQMVSKSDISPLYVNKAKKLRDQAEKLKDNDQLAEAAKKESEANKVLELGKFASYKRTPGEVEARLTQSRMNLTDTERRSLFPLERGKYGVDVNTKKIKGLLNY